MSVVAGAKPGSSASSGQLADEKGRVAVREEAEERGGIYREDIDTSEVNERKLLRKVDMRLIPWLSLLYLLSFLDRTSIGNAKVCATSHSGTHVVVRCTNHAFNPAVWIGNGLAYHRQAVSAFSYYLLLPVRPL